MEGTSDEIILDGTNNVQSWPVDLAESLLADTASWAHERFEDFYYLATCVNGYHRHDFGSAWGPELLEEVKSGDSWKMHSTQELLDLVFTICRADRFSDGLIKDEEPQLRRIVQEVVQRIRTDR